MFLSSMCINFKYELEVDIFVQSLSVLPVISSQFLSPLNFIIAELGIVTKMIPNSTTLQLIPSYYLSCSSFKYSLEVASINYQHIVSIVSFVLRDSLAHLYDMQILHQIYHFTIEFVINQTHVRLYT